MMGQSPQSERRLTPHISSSLLLLNSKILISKQKIIDLFPRIEKTLESIKDADNTVMQMQIKRQREFWHLLKIACVSDRKQRHISKQSNFFYPFV